MRHSSSLCTVLAMTGPRQLALISLAALAGAAAAAPLSAGASGYGQLIARRNAAPSASFATRFAHVRPPRSFVLVVNEPTDAPLMFRWSLRCVGASPRENGGASGEATVSSGRWVKRVRADWIKHPVACSGGISGSAAAHPVLARVFAD
ncbi:MAG TPA: hypothetical protein VK707_03860 [Solirubrobacteraceae bacterium]|jgi:hypothetical protein|nr:hypothetical protein [Solirubrobacteraceae bacterium]